MIVKRKQNYLRLVTALMILIMVSVGVSEAAEVILPGKYEHMVHYITFAYSAPQEDILFHLNEILLMEHMPTYEELDKYLGYKHSNIPRMRRRQRIVFRELKRATKMTFTMRFQMLMRQYRLLKEHLIAQYGGVDAQVTLDLTNPGEEAEAERIFDLMGLKLCLDNSGDYALVEHISAPAYDVNRLYMVLGVNPWKVSRSLTKTRKWEFKATQCKLNIPWEMEFFQKATGMMVKESTFIEMLINDPKLVRLLGILYRLSDQEIQFISDLEQDYGAWRRIYGDPLFLNGMFLLSHGLRVDKDRILLPGGEKAREFWKKMTGIDPVDQPLLFLQNLTTKEEGKLNYFYVFGFFLPKANQEAAFCDFQPQRFGRLYRMLQLERSEKLQPDQNPELEPYSIFNYFYALQSRDNALYFPGGLAAWTEAMGVEENTFDALTAKLIKDSSDKKRNGIDKGFASFTPIYSKFMDRPQAMTPQVIRALYQNYSDYNVMIDYMEKLPLKKPDTMLKMLQWAKSFDTVSGTGSRDTATAIMQSLLTFLTQGAYLKTSEKDFDALVEALMKIPLKGTGLYDGVFDFLDSHCAVDMEPTRADISFLQFATGQLKDIVVKMNGQEYTLRSTALLKQEISRLMVKQETFSFSGLLRINRLLERFTRDGQREENYRQIVNRIKETLEMLPRMEPNGEKLLKQTNRLLDKHDKRISLDKIHSVIADMKDGGLLKELKHLLVTAVYGVSVKNSNLRLFVNPNIVRMHDFSPHGKSTAWNCSQVATVAKGKPGETVYHMEGGLSRMEITLAIPFGEHLFRRRMGYDTAQVASIVYNNFSLFPLAPGLETAQHAAGELVEAGKQLLEEAQKDNTVKENVARQLAFLTSGYRYRKIMEKLSGQSPKYQPYYRLLAALGETVKPKPSVSSVSSVVQKNPLHPLGPIYYHTFGKLTPYRFRIFPQPLTHLFKAGNPGGEMVDEFKIKAAYINDKRDMPADLLGHLTYRFMFYSAAYFSNFYENDYHKTYFIYDTYNYLYMNRIYKELKQFGILRIR